MSDTVIQINSLAALQRLFGDDPKIRVAVRESVIHRFAQGHLRIEGFLGEIKQAVMLEASNKITAEIGTLKSTAYGMRDIKLYGHVATAIQDEVKNQLSDLIRACAINQMEMLRPEISKRVEERVRYYFNDFVDTEIKKRIDEVRKKL